MTESAAPRGRAAAALLGVLSMASQVLLFREGLARAGGDELSVGAMLGAWLMAGAAGAWLAARPRRTCRLEMAAALLLLGAALAGGVVTWRRAPAPGGALPGERVGLLPFFVQAVSSLGPAALLQGWMLARLARRWRAGAAGLFAWEAIGCAAAGLLLALEPVLALLPAGDARDTRHGRYRIMRRGEETWLQSFGVDTWLLRGAPAPTHAAALRAALSVLPPGARVLVRSDLALLPEVLTRDPARVDVLVPDDAVAELAARGAGPELSAALADPRVAVHASTVRGFWRRGGANAAFDLVWYGAVEPAYAAAAREVTEEGFALAREHLGPRGLLGLRLAAVDGVAGSLGMRRAADVAAAADATGLQVLALPDGTLLAAQPGALPAPGEIEKSWPEPLQPAALRALNLALRGSAADPLQELLQGEWSDPASWPPFRSAEPHRDRRPGATASSHRMLEEHARGGQPGLLAFLHSLGAAGFAALASAFLLGFALLVPGGPQRRLQRGLDGFTLTTNATAGAALLLLLLERLQAISGALYGDLGWASGAFLAGFAGGAAMAGSEPAAARGGAGADARDLGTGADLLLLGGGMAVFLWASLPDPPLGGAAVSALLLGAAVGHPVGRAATAHPAWAWGMDLLGSAPGAWLTGVWLLPAAGWSGTLWAVAAVKGVALLLRGAAVLARRGR